MTGTLSTVADAATELKESDSIYNDDQQEVVGDAPPLEPITDSSGHQTVHEGMEIMNQNQNQKMGTDNEFTVDIVHVFGTAHAAKLDSSTKMKRELSFFVDTPSLFVGDFAMDMIEREAKRLLRGLLFFRSSAKNILRPIVFIAYDFGALVLKQAIAISGLERREWPGIFNTAVRFVFHGCFHRGDSIESLGRKIVEVMIRQPEAPFSVMSAYSLARATLLTTRAFLESKITLRSHVDSLYANQNKARIIDKVFDYYTATIGHPTECTMEEMSGDHERFPGLGDQICFDIPSEMSRMPIVSIKHDYPSVSPFLASPPKPADFSEEWNLESASWPWEEILLSLTPQHQQLQSKSSRPMPSVLDVPEYKRWESTRGVHMLYIHGLDREATNDAAEQIYHLWKDDCTEQGNYNPSCFYYSFASSNQCNKPTAKDMMCALLFHIISFSSFDRKQYLAMVRDQFEIQKAWTIKDVLIHVLDIFQLQLIGRGITLVLQDIDRCAGPSLQAFFTALNEKASTTENLLHIVVTAEDKFILDDLIPDIGIDYYDPSKDVNKARDDLANIVSGLCPSDIGMDRIRRGVEAVLPSLGVKDLERMLNIIKRRTKWPSESSVKSLRLFYDLLESFSAIHPGTSIVDHVLKSIPNQEALAWTLGWLAVDDFQLTTRELAIIRSCYEFKMTHSLANLTDADLDEAISDVETWLGGIIDFSQGSVFITDDMREMLESSLIFKEAKETTPRAICTFISSYLTSKEIQKGLDLIFSSYEHRISLLEGLPTPPLIPRAEKVLFCAIRRFPRLLSDHDWFLKELLPKLISGSGPFTPWAKVYWAMENPLSRGRLPTFTSAGQLLVELGALKDESRSILENNITDAVVDDAHLALSLREGNEESALILLKHLFDDFSPNIDKQKEQVHAALWRATWLGMNRVVEIILENGIAPDPTEISGDITVSTSFVSPLDMACVLGRTEISKMLTEHGAKTEYEGVEETAELAARKGHAGCLSHLILMNDRLSSYTPDMKGLLYLASDQGQWKAVKTLLELQFDPNTGIKGDGHTGGRIPLIAAAEQGYLKTMKILLENGANVKILESQNESTGVYFNAAKAGSIEVVRLLLEHGADLSHKWIMPPLFAELARSRNLSTEDKLAIMDLVFENTPSIINVNQPTITIAAAKAHVALIRWLLDHGAEADLLDNQGMTALFYAVRRGNVEAAQCLLESGLPNLDIVAHDGSTLLSNAMTDNHPEFIEMLLERGANINMLDGSGVPLINKAVVGLRVGIVHLLISKKAELHHRDNMGSTPLMDAVSYAQNADMIRMLVEAGARLNDTDNQGDTILHHSIGINVDTLKILLEYRTSIDIEQCNNVGATPLMWMVRNPDPRMAGKNPKMVETMLRAGADVNAQDKYLGRTPLMFAVAQGVQGEVIELLLNHPKLDINMSSRNQGTALQMACQRLNLDLVKKLLAKGADPNTHHLKVAPQFGCARTALIDACFWWPRQTIGDDDEKIERLVRELVNHGARPEATCGCGHCSPGNALSSAALGAGPHTINCLIGEGASCSVQQPDTLGRLPIHFAAANGLLNFEAILPAYREEDKCLTTLDKAGKSALHWAAQFGHAKTVEAILNGLTPAERKASIEAKDVDGWTALCWACRPFSSAHIRATKSEEHDYAATVRILLEAGADQSIQCAMGTGSDAELVSMSVMARRCGADPEHIRLLENGEQQSNDQLTPKYRIIDDAWCDICCGAIIGLRYRCQSCPNFDACKKCYGRIDLYHGHVRFWGENAPHTFQVAGGDNEFDDPPPTPSSANAGPHSR